MTKLSLISSGTLAVVAGLFTPFTSARAADVATPAAPAAPQPPCITGSITSSLPPALADPGGARAALAAKGIQFQLNYIGEVLGNVAGGMRQGAIYDNRLELCVDLDLEKLAGWEGASLHANGYWIGGTGELSDHYVGNLLLVSNIEADPAIRLYEAWFEQKFGDKFALRIGQQGADMEFVTSSNAALFINSTFGWPGINASDLPSGGPAYPLATPAVRLKYTPSEQWTFLLALFNGNPAGPGSGDPEQRDPYGVNFRVTDPPLLIGEAQYTYTLGTDLPGTVKFGGWQHFGTFADERFDTLGLPLASPLSNDIAQSLSGNDGIYGIIDQMIYHLPGDDPAKGVGVFARVSASPPDRNLSDFYVDGGVTFNGMVPGRTDDSFGLAFAYMHISDAVSAAKEDVVYYSGVPSPIQDYEAALELIYVAQIVKGWTVQPDIQYILHPGGHVANPLDPTGAAIPNALVVGLRTTVNY